jgi:hypothetical protein
MGALLTRALHGTPLPGPGQVMDLTELSLSVRTQFAGALHQVFLAGAVVSAAGLVATLFLPVVDFGRGVLRGSGERMLAAEMATLAPKDEPVALSE